ncbi:MAG: ribosome hibernation-promoting factor, HPF/YfiA family [Minisyncoccia bacterium]
MKIIIKATNLELTSAIQNYIEKKFQSLNKFLKKYEEKSEINLNIEIAKTTRHHHKGEIFYTEVNLNLPNHFLRVEEYASDLYAAIDLAKDKMKTEILRLKSFKEKTKRQKNKND